jgi:hypothetical protein
MPIQFGAKVNASSRTETIVSVKNALLPKTVESQGITDINQHR